MDEFILLTSTEIIFLLLLEEVLLINKTEIEERK